MLCAREVEKKLTEKKKKKIYEKCWCLATKQIAEHNRNPYERTFLKSVI